MKYVIILALLLIFSIVTFIVYCCLRLGAATDAHIPESDDSEPNRP